LTGSIKNYSKVTYSDKSTFKGQISHNNVPDGIGRLELENGDFYEGEFKDGMFDGKGRLKMKDGKLYEGTWSMNMREGNGKESWLDGKSYEGSFKRDQKNGYGKIPNYWVNSKVCLNGLMEVPTQATSEMTKSMDSVCLNGVMANSLKEIGETL